MITRPGGVGGCCTSSRAASVSCHTHYNSRQQVLSKTKLRPCSTQILQQRFCCLETMNVAFKDSHVETCATSDAREQQQKTQKTDEKVHSWHCSSTDRLSCQHLADTTHLCTPRAHTMHGDFDKNESGWTPSQVRRDLCLLWAGPSCASKCSCGQVSSSATHVWSQMDTSKRIPGSFCQEVGMKPSPLNRLTSARQQGAHQRTLLLPSCT